MKDTGAVLPVTIAGSHYSTVNVIMVIFLLQCVTETEKSSKLPGMEPGGNESGIRANAFLALKVEKRGLVQEGALSRTQRSPPTTPSMLITCSQKAGIEGIPNVF